MLLYINQITMCVTCLIISANSGRAYLQNEACVPELLQVLQRRHRPVTTLLPQELHNVRRNLLQLHLRPHPPEHVEAGDLPKHPHVPFHLLDGCPRLFVAVILDDVVQETGVHERPVGGEELEYFLDTCRASQLRHVLREPAEVL